MSFYLDEQAILKQGQTDGVTHYATGLAVMKNDKVLIVKRVAHDWLGDNWELPGGGVDPG